MSLTDAPTRPHFLMRLAHRLAPPRVDALVIALALALVAPSLTVGLATDDHLHKVFLRDEPVLDGFAPTHFDLFVFASGDPADMRALMQRGVFPWTTDPHLRLAFFRPLSALTHVADDALWPASPALAHAQNIVWFAALLIVLGRLYRRVHVAAPWVAGLALLLYAIDDAHGPTIGWIANRQAIISAVFGFLAVLAYVRHRRTAYRPGALLGPLAFALSLLAGESGIATAAYLVAYALTLDSAAPRARALALAPYLAVAVAWGAVYVALGYGARGSGIYVEPLADPLAFASAAASHIPVLVAAQFAGVWSEIYGALSSSAVRWLVIGSIIYGLLLLDALKTLLKTSPEARFWFVATVLSAVPIAGTVPADRLLVFVGVGATGLIACFFQAPEGTPGTRAPGRVRRVSIALWTGGFILTHLLLAPLLLPVRSLGMSTVAASVERADDSIPKDPSVRAKTVIAMNPPADPYLAYVPIMRASRGEPIPGALRWLAVGQTDITLTREDAQTLLVRPAGGYLAMPTEQMVRSTAHPIPLGYRLTFQDVAIEVIERTPDGRPAATRWRFHEPLESPSYHWLLWSEDGPGFVPTTPPAVGATVTLPKVDTLRAFLGD